jgi:hypothetical protein
MDSNLIGYSDASWADAGDRKSTSGYLWIYTDAPIMWKTTKQKIIALSSCESEYISAASAAKEGMWLKRLVLEIINPDHTPIMYMDNQSAIAIASGSSSSERTKHIDLRYHYLKLLVSEGGIKIDYISTKFMLADSLTKPVFKRITSTIHN